MIFSVRPVVLGVALAMLVIPAPSRAAAQQTAPSAQNGLDCMRIMADIQQLEQDQAKIEADVHALTQQLYQLNDEIDGDMKAVSYIRKQGYLSEETIGKILDSLADLMRLRVQIKQQLDTDADALQKSMNTIEALRNKLAGCGPPSAMTPPRQDGSNPPSPPPSTPPTQTAPASLPAAPSEQAPPGQAASPQQTNVSLPASPDCDRIKHDIEMLQQDLDHQTAEMQTFQKQMDDVNQTVAQMQTTLDELDAERNSIGGTLSRLIFGEDDSYAAIKSSALDSMAKMKDAMQKLQQFIDADAKQIQSLKDQIAALLKLIANCKPPAAGASQPPQGTPAPQPLSGPLIQPAPGPAPSSPPAAPTAPATPAMPAPTPQGTGEAPSTVPAPPATPAPPAQSPQGQTSQVPNSDYGSGGHAVMQNDTAGAELHGAVYDPSGTLRHEETNTYTTTGGVEHKTEQHADDFDFKGHLQLGLDYKYDLRGGLNYSDITHYGLHGERIAEEVTNYRTDGYEIKDWSLGTHQWYTNTIPYKTPLPTGTPSQAPLTPTNTNIGVLIPRSYLPGETITGSLWPSTYAENFKSVPGLSEYSFPIELYHLPDGSPEWSSLRIGVKGDGYVPVNPNGTFSVHIPFDWKGSLQLQVRLDTPVAGVAPGNALLNIDPPVAAPTLPDNLFSQAGHLRLHDDEEDYLVSLWEDACDIEERLDYLYGQANPDWERIFDLEDDLDWYYREIDYIEDDLPPSEVIKLAQEMLDEANSVHAWLGGKSNLTEDDKDDLDDCESWIDFLKDEIGYNRFLAAWGPGGLDIQPYWTNPVLTRGHLGEIGGNFSLDPYDTIVRIDNTPITPLAATPHNWYFMPPSGLTAGQHNFIIDSPLFPETIFPVFNMTMDESIVTNKMLTGQSTSYRFTLNGMNGVPAGAWSGSYYPTDLVGSSELSAAQQAVGNSRTGFITFSVTNETPDVISMQNVFKVLDASSFVPNGSDTIEGGIGALKKGNFLIDGEAHAYLNPMIGIGVPPGTTLPTGLTNPLAGSPSGNWFPPFSVNYDPAAFSNSSFMTNCPGSGVAPAATGSTAPGHADSTSSNSAGSATTASTCPASIFQDLFPQVPGNQHSAQVDNTSAMDAAKQRFLNAVKNVKAAADKLTRLGTDMDADWNAAVRDLPQDDQDDYNKTAKRYSDSLTERNEMERCCDKNPTEENLEKFEAAERELAIDEGIFRRFKESMIERFSPKDRAAWQASRDAFEKAQAERSAAESEYRAAESDYFNMLRAAGTK
jgi:hypothetical protein